MPNKNLVTEKNPSKQIDWPDPEAVPAWVLKLFNSAKSNAKKGHTIFGLKQSDLYVLWERCEGRCAVSGLDFTHECVEGALVKYPFAPSLDRIVPAQGYVAENVRLVCTVANFAMNQWGVDVLRRVAYGVVEMEQKAYRDWYRRQRRKLRKLEKQAENLSGPEKTKQNQRIAGAKRALTLGPTRLSATAGKAKKTLAQGHGSDDAA